MFQLNNTLAVYPVCWHALPNKGQFCIYQQRMEKLEPVMFLVFTVLQGVKNGLFTYLQRLTGARLSANHRASSVAMERTSCLCKYLSLLWRLC